MKDMRTNRAENCPKRWIYLPGKFNAVKNKQPFWNECIKKRLGYNRPQKNSRVLYRLHLIAINENSLQVLNYFTRLLFLLRFKLLKVKSFLTLTWRYLWLAIDGAPPAFYFAFASSLPMLRMQTHLPALLLFINNSTPSFFPGGHSRLLIFLRPFFPGQLPVSPVD